MLNQLTEYFKPNKLLHRENQIKEIEKVFINYKTYGVAQNLVLMGSSGTGKTTTIQHIIQKRDNSIYVSAADAKTSIRILQRLCPPECKTIDKIIKHLKETLKKNPKILVIDELNKVTNLSMLFDDLNTIYREVQIPIILITNKPDLISKMPDDARKTLFISRVNFAPYDALQLYDILKDRLRLIPEKATKDVPEGILRFICAQGIQLDGSARIVLDLTMKCIMEQNFTQDFVNKKILEKQKDDWNTFVADLPPLERKFLRTLLDMYMSDKDITPSELLKKMEGHSPNRISNLITSFENYGVISTEYINKGRAQGRYRVITMSQDMFSKLDGLVEI